MRGKSTFLILGLSLVAAFADLIECDNGDKYNGKVLSMDEKTVKLKNEIAGTLAIPRERIVSISFRPGPPAQATIKAPPATAGLNSLDPAKKLKVDPTAVERVQNELLATATPEANQMFQEMIRGLQSGQLNLGDIRSQAETTLRELREAQKDLGDDDLAGLLNSYGAILESFLRQTPPRGGVPAPIKPPKSPPTEDKGE